MACYDVVSIVCRSLYGGTTLGRTMCCSTGGTRGRGLHSSTFQHNVSTFCLQQTSTFRLDVSTFCGLCSEVASAKTSQVELRSGRLLWLQ